MALAERDRHLVHTGSEGVGKRCFDRSIRAKDGARDLRRADPQRERLGGGGLAIHVGHHAWSEPVASQQQLGADAGDGDGGLDGVERKLILRPEVAADAATEGHAGEHRRAQAAREGSCRFPR